MLPACVLAKLPIYQGVFFLFPPALCSVCIEWISRETVFQTKSLWTVTLIISNKSPQPCNPAWRKSFTRHLLHDSAAFLRHLIAVLSCISSPTKTGAVSDKIPTLPRLLDVLQKQLDLIYSGHTAVIISSSQWQATERIKLKITQHARGSSDVQKYLPKFLSACSTVSS